MKICLVGLENLPVLAPGYDDCQIGGAQVQQTLLARALVRAGYDVSMVVADYGQPDGAVWDGIRTWKAYAPDAGVPVLRFVHPRWSGMYAALGKAGADVYFTTCAGMQVGLIGLFCRRRGRRFVFRAASDSDCDSAKLLVRHARDRWLYARGLRCADSILVQSKGQARSLALSYGLSGHLVGSFVERADPAPVRRDIDVLWVANIRHVKRPDRVLALAQALPHLAFHMVGGTLPGEEGLYDEIRRRAEKIDNVVFHGRLSYRATNALYSRARLLVNTSDVEGFPSSYLQAWACGVPTVAFFDPDGIIERERLGAGVITEADMRAEIARIGHDSRVWRRASRRCRDYIAREFNEDKILARYLEAFEGSHWHADAHAASLVVPGASSA